MSKNITSLILLMIITFNNTSVFAATPKSVIKDKATNSCKTPKSINNQHKNKRPKIDFGLPNGDKLTTDTASLLTADNIKPFTGFTSKIKPDETQTEIGFKMLSTTGGSNECFTSGCRLRQMMETSGHTPSAQNFISPPKIDVTITY